MSINSLHGLQKKIDEADEHGQENDGRRRERGENERDEVESRTRKADEEDER
jgi:hypothetical protein